jgi:putative transposase
MSLITEACAAGARRHKACEVLGLSVRTLQRWQGGEKLRSDGRKAVAGQRTPANKLSESERAELLTLANSAVFADKPPSQIVPALADQGRYIASESTFYRVLKAEKQSSHRGRSRPPTHHRPEPCKATGPNRLWSWDITYLATTVRGVFFYLYLYLDLYSRKIVGWEVFAEESAEHAGETVRKACWRERVAPETLTLHSDNGSPMKGATMLATLQRLGIMPSFSRPSVSNDNAFSEAMFKTLKYHPSYPDKSFENLEQARAWVAEFVHWYNEQHRHSAIKFVTPGQRHRGEDIDILAHRQALYEAARRARPERWSGSTRDWAPADTVTLNPNRSTLNKESRQPKAA